MGTVCGPYLRNPYAQHELIEDGRVRAEVGEHLAGRRAAPEGLAISVHVGEVARSLHV